MANQCGYTKMIHSRFQSSTGLRERLIEARNTKPVDDRSSTVLMEFTDRDGNQFVELLLLISMME